MFLAAGSAVPFSVTKEQYQWFNNISCILFFRKKNPNVHMINSFLVLV